MLKSILNKLYMTDAVAIDTVNKIIAEQAPLIIKDLGLEINDGILDRICALTFIPSEDQAHSAIFRHIATTYGFMSSKGEEYKIGSGRVEINAVSPMYFRNKKGKVLHMAIIRLPFFVSLYRKYIIGLLAHELRHYWQFYTGEVFRQTTRFNGMSFMPYEWRWEEKDANDYARKYLDSLKLKEVK